MDGVLRDDKAKGKPYLNKVSILVLMDGVLRGEEPDAQESCFICFNPCSNGWCTSSSKRRCQGGNGVKVSILVLMDGVLRAAL